MVKMVWVEVKTIFKDETFTDYEFVDSEFWHMAEYPEYLNMDTLCEMIANNKHGAKNTRHVYESVWKIVDAPPKDIYERRLKEQYDKIKQMSKKMKQEKKDLDTLLAMKPKIH